MHIYNKCLRKLVSKTNRINNTVFAAGLVAFTLNKCDNKTWKTYSIHYTEFNRYSISNVITHNV